MDPADALRQLLGLRWPPVALAFAGEPSGGIPRIAEAAPAGCSYWRLAAQGAVFHTGASDRFGCVISAHTHGVDLPPQKGRELQSMFGVMTGLGYIRGEELTPLPRCAGPFRAVVYAPLEKRPLPPDALRIRGNARQIMLLAEAARAAGIAHAGSALGRPACAMAPAALPEARGILGLGGIGNRVYTALGDDELERFHRSRA